ncbi:MAG: NAD(P)H-dependent oxidoreductase [Paracoccaceae bacterium]
MRVLVVYCHPNPKSFNAAIRDLVVERAKAVGAEIQVLDLYAEGFDPLLSLAEFEIYETVPDNTSTVARHVEAIRWCDTLIFVYPTWWYAHPAMLKGWLDRVLLPGVAGEMPDGGDIRPTLTHITRLGVFTTCGASWWLTRFIGFPGRRVILRGIRILCAKRCRTTFLAHYLMDASTPKTRDKHLMRVRRTMDRLMAGGSR